jgi:2-polyprenyl-3-methyl-5-hydroxy-6-metoxy-1,4-benzoquinol methylase
MASMATEQDPAGIMPRAILDAADFRQACVLEVGAGDGRLTHQYASEPRSVVAIDTKESEIRTAEQCSQRLGRNVQFLCASATDLPFPAERFGIVLLASSL